MRFCIILSFVLRAGVRRPYVEKKLTATEKSATDGDWSATTLGRHKLAYDRIQLVADSRTCSTSTTSCRSTGTSFIKTQAT